ncbi:MAG: hypothetical protein ACRDOV_16985, partial [Streptomyces sp.]
MAETAMPRSVRLGPGGEEPAEPSPLFGGGAPAQLPAAASPVDRAVWRLRSRGCWEDAAALLDPYAADDAAASVRRAALLVERCMFTADGWTAAEAALRAAEALAQSDEARGAAACE